jgi:hypothetical protein
VPTKADETALGLFHRKILRSIFEAMQDKGQWRRCNFELQWNFYKSNSKGNKKIFEFRNTFFLLVFELNLHQAYVL